MSGDASGARPAGHRTVEQVKLLKMSDEVTAALGRTGVDDELARDVIERTQHRDFLGLSRRRNAQVRADLGPNPGEIGMCQRFTLVAVQKHDIAGFGLALAQLQTQTDPIHLVCDLPSLQRVPRAPPTELFFRNALDNCERLMRTPSVFSISARSRAIVQFGRLAVGAPAVRVVARRRTRAVRGVLLRLVRKGARELDQLPREFLQLFPGQVPEPVVVHIVQLIRCEMRHVVWRIAS